MDIQTRRARLSDLPQMLEVEKAAIRLCYLQEVHQDFFSDDRGEMTVATQGDTILGFGKLTIQYDGSAWAELLRVHPDYQGMGAGKAIWKRYMEQCRDLHCPYIRMYTGVTNVVSKHLAEKNGLDRAVEFSECSIPIAGNEGAVPGFAPISYEQAAPQLSALTDTWGDYACFNRTFYHFGAPFLKAMADEGKLYSDGHNIVALGCRFMPERGMHIGFMLGDFATCIAFARGEAARRGAPQLTIMHKAGFADLQQALTADDFTYLSGNLYMLEGKL